MNTTDIHYKEISWQGGCCQDAHLALWGGKDIQKGAPVLKDLTV